MAYCGKLKDFFVGSACCTVFPTISRTLGLWLGPYSYRIIIKVFQSFIKTSVLSVKIVWSLGSRQRCKFVCRIIFEKLKLLSKSGRIGCMGIKDKWCTIAHSVRPDMANPWLFGSAGLSPTWSAGTSGKQRALFLLVPNGCWCNVLPTLQGKPATLEPHVDASRPSATQDVSRGTSSLVGLKKVAP